MEAGADNFFKVAADYGIFAALFIGLFLAVLYIFWLMIKSNMSEKTALVESTQQSIKNYEDIKDILTISNQTNKNLFEQLSFLKKNCIKQNSCYIDIVSILKSITDDKDLEIRLDNLIKEIQRPVE